MDVEISRNVII